MLSGPAHPSPGEHITPTPVVIGIGPASSPLPRDSRSTSLRELWCGHVAPENTSSGQQGEQIELALIYNFSIHYS